MAKVHLEGKNREPVCNSHRRWMSCVITGTKNKKLVTCLRCKAKVAKKG